jgi:hypothetical protein
VYIHGVLVRYTCKIGTNYKKMSDVFCLRNIA